MVEVVDMVEMYFEQAGVYGMEGGVERWIRSEFFVVSRNVWWDSWSRWILNLELSCVMLCYVCYATRGRSGHIHIYKNIFL